MILLEVIFCQVLLHQLQQVKAIPPCQSKLRIQMSLKTALAKIKIDLTFYLQRKKTVMILWLIMTT
jgi:hypothetical protein